MYSCLCCDWLQPTGRKKEVLRSELDWWNTTTSHATYGRAQPCHLPLLQGHTDPQIFLNASFSILPLPLLLLLICDAHGVLPGGVRDGLLRVRGHRRALQGARFPRKNRAPVPLDRLATGHRT